MKKLMILLGVIIMLSFVVGSNLTSQKDLMVYTPSTDTICSGGICTKTLYSGIRNVQEDNKWKRVEDARSLVGSGVEVVYLENDKEFPIEVIDYNYTSITLDLKKFSILNQDIPVKILKKNETTGLNDVLKTNDVVSFNELSNSKRKTYSFSYGDVLKFGFDSTTIILQEPDTENLEDTFTDADSVSDKGSLTTIFTGSYDISDPENTELRLYIKFSLSSIPVGSTIIYSNLSFNVISNNYDNGETANFSVFEISNQSWIESINYNTAPSEGKIITLNDTIDGDWPGGWLTFNVTSWVESEHNDLKLNVSFLCKSFEVPPSDEEDNIQINSKEWTLDNSKRPILIITYTEPPPTPITKTLSLKDNGYISLESNGELRFRN